ncbi:MAG: Metallophos protein [Acidobacteriota bacterium]|nr:Metallophos protein [Acidobacteriota bacterium]
MLKWVLVIAIYVFMHYYCYKKISTGFGLSSRWNTIVKIFLVFAGSLYLTTQFIHFVFSVPMHHLDIVYPLIYCGFLWILALPTLCAMCFLATGLTLASPTMTRWWLRGIPVVFAFRIFLLSKGFHYGKQIPAYHEISRFPILLAIYLLAAALLYKIITGTLKLPDKKKGGLIIIFSLGPVLAFFGLGVTALSLLFGFYAVVFARVSAGLELTKKNKRIILAILFIGIIISLPQMLWWGNGLGIRSLYYIGGAWYGFIIMAITLFLLESGVAFIFPSHPRRRVIIVLALLFVISGYGLYNGLKVPIVKEIVIPIKKLPADTPDFTIVQWSDIHLGDLVSQDWFRETVTKTNSLKPDLLVITGDIIDNGFQKKDIEPLKQLKTKFGILAVTGNHEYYFNRLNIFLETAAKVGIRVLRNELVTLPNGIQIAGINDPTAEEYGDKPPSVAEALKNSDPQNLIILLSHKAHYFKEAAQQGIDLQLSGHNHVGQLPILDLFIYLTIKYPYGLYREGDAYIYTSCGTGFWAIPMRIFTRGEITKITLKTDKKE